MCTSPKCNLKTFLGNIEKEFHIIAEAATGGVL